ncbi:hypothetical protein GCM10008090_01190 [Arenicella chitinivorans]|uniref:Uncharacterized protein n=1 Tax=Arenicella chitinivorans TaxID=1329800 RepID=A0A918RHP1_9GAMM|nr:hypothetical protein GCM10008090_01190 [Arenicella chitinivorans]
MNNNGEHGVALALFLLAGVFYILGWVGSASVLSILGVVIELAAWISLFSKDRNRKPD